MIAQGAAAALINAARPFFYPAVPALSSAKHGRITSRARHVRALTAQAIVERPGGPLVRRGTPVRRLAGMARTGSAKQWRALNVSDRQGFNQSNGVWRWQYDR